MAPRRPTAADHAAALAATLDWPCLSLDKTGACLLDVVVTPNAPRTRADGLHDGALRVRLNAPPVDGKANDALQAWLADELGLQRRAVVLLRGQAARRKQWQLDASAAAVATWLAQQLKDAGPGR